MDCFTSFAMTPWQRFCRALEPDRVTASEARQSMAAWVVDGFTSFAMTL
jgi:hypothetical protein